MHQGRELLEIFVVSTKFENPALIQTRNRHMKDWSKVHTSALKHKYCMLLYIYMYYLKATAGRGYMVI